jgi:pimeloyl-ACP methyl ester carboxylesterase
MNPMKKFKKMLLIVLGISIGLFLLIQIFLFFFQEKLIFFPTKLSGNHQYHFNQPFEEVRIPVESNVKLHGLFFKADSSKGLLFYLHGNAGSSDSWGAIAKTYTDLNYDIFILDYRGFGKSEGKIHSQEQFYKDVQLAYDYFKLKYKEDKIVIIGYSIGTAVAAKLASENNPKYLILQAPYYSLVDLMHSFYGFVPTYILKYKFETFNFVRNTKAPIIIFHGDQDRVIKYQASLKLKPLLKPNDQLIILEGEGHNGITDNKVYQKELKKILY